MFWDLKILFFSWRNSPVTPGRNLLSEGLERGPFMVLRFFKGIAEGPIVFGRMRDGSVLYFDTRMSG